MSEWKITSKVVRPGVIWRNEQKYLMKYHFGFRKIPARQQQQQKFICILQWKFPFIISTTCNVVLPLWMNLITTRKTKIFSQTNKRNTNQITNIENLFNEATFLNEKKYLLFFSLNKFSIETNNKPISFPLIRSAASAAQSPTIYLHTPT